MRWHHYEELLLQLKSYIWWDFLSFVFDKRAYYLWTRRIHYNQSKILQIPVHCWNHAIKPVMFVRVWLMVKIPCPQWSYFIRMCLYKWLLCTNRHGPTCSRLEYKKTQGYTRNPQWLILVWLIKRTQCWSLKLVTILLLANHKVMWDSLMSLKTFIACIQNIQIFYFVDITH